MYVAILYVKKSLNDSSLFSKFGTILIPEACTMFDDILPIVYYFSPSITNKMENTLSGNLLMTGNGAGMSRDIKLITVALNSVFTYLPNE